jgi:hypothetical protein
MVVIQAKLDSRKSRAVRSTYFFDSHKGPQTNAVSPAECRESCGNPKTNGFRASPTGVAVKAWSNGFTVKSHFEGMRG